MQIEKAFTCAKENPLPTSSIPCRRSPPTWLQQMFKDPTYSISWLSMTMPTSGKSKITSSFTYRNSYWNSALASAFVGNQYHLTVDEKIITLTCSSITSNCTLMSSSKSNRENFCRNTQASWIFTSPPLTTLRGPGDNPSIGLILCRSESRLTVEYALLDVKKPIEWGNSSWRKSFPKNWKVICQPLKTSSGN